MSSVSQCKTGVRKQLYRPGREKFDTKRPKLVGVVACGAAEWVGEQTAQRAGGVPLIQACVRTRV